MKNYASYSYWLQSCGDDLTPRPRLNGTIDADIAILGAGYSGLWTAWYLLERDPNLKIVILEREIAGFGASGRNGGWCTSGFPTSLDQIEKKYGRSQAIATHQAMTGAVAEVGRVAQEQGIDIDWQKSGTLMTARGTRATSVGPSRRRNDGSARVRGRISASREEAARRADSHCRIGGRHLSERKCRHPSGQTGAWSGARGGEARRDDLRADERDLILRRRVSGAAHRSRSCAGGNDRPVWRVLYERTEGGWPAAHAGLFADHADRTTLRRANGKQSAGRDASGRFLPATLSTISPRRSTGASSSAGAARHITFVRQIKDYYDRHEETHKMLENNVRTWFPMLKDVKFTHTWGGPLGWPRDFMPTIAYDPRDNVATARGYTGQGVATDQSRRAASWPT